MKDLYKLLGISKESSDEVIKKAYKKLASEHHPDKGGDPELMQLLNEAKETLSDPDKRAKYNEDFENYKNTDLDLEKDNPINGFLSSGNTRPYSDRFREKHRHLVLKFGREPMTNCTLPNYNPIDSKTYSLVDKDNTTHYFSDIFSFSRAKAKHFPSIGSFVEPEKLTPKIVINIFLDFLSGKYYGQDLEKIIGYFNSNTTLMVNTAVLDLFRGICEIISFSITGQINKSSFKESIEKINVFTVNASEDELKDIVPLFYNKYYKNLFLYALNLHLYSSTSYFRNHFFDFENMSAFDGSQKIKEYISILRSNFSNPHIDRGVLEKLLNYIKILYFFDNESNEDQPDERSPADKIRENAFHLLDCIPALLSVSDQTALANTFLQIGLQFQRSTLKESDLHEKMADEQLALDLYLTAYLAAKNSTPDIEIYFISHILKLVLHFMFTDANIINITSVLKERLWALTEIFPIFSHFRSNFSFFNEKSRYVNLMRKILNSLIDLQQGKSADLENTVDYNPVTVLYNAYEACLKMWFQEEYDPEVENRFRSSLMDELLFEHSWTFLDVERNIASPWIMIDRDEDGWIKPSRSLPYNVSKEHQPYSTVNGFEINNKTGEINFFMTPWTPDRPIYEKLFTTFDLQEMLEKNIEGAIFSLDPVDPNMPYHPFNALRFAPSQLYESELLNSMLLTDYILKFLTTNQEVQGEYPFQQRPVAHMIKHLPEYLREIITDLHASQHDGALHRFWIQADETDVLSPDENSTNDAIERFSVKNIKMIVKKHRMERDLHGELKDVGDEDEGWPFYVISKDSFQKLVKEEWTIEDGNAMLFVDLDEDPKLYYWENNAVIRTHTPQKSAESLIRLSLQARDEDGKVKQTDKNFRLIYRITKEMAHQSGISHRYSPEFIFAHEFTTHYDEFAQYLPEFGRLKELSKMTVLIRVLSGLRESNKQALEAINYILNNARIHKDEYNYAESNHSNHPKTEVYVSYKNTFQKISSKNSFWEAEEQFKLFKTRKDLYETAFSKINLGEDDKPIDLTGTCLWVPASVRHEVAKDGTSGLSRFSFFTYGGVNIQPRINVIPAGNSPLKGNPVGGGSFNRIEIRKGFQNHHIISHSNAATKNHELLKLAGFDNIDARPNRIYLPKYENQHPTRAIHDGRHIQPAMDDVAEKMHAIVRTGKANNWDQSQYRSALRNLLSDERQRLRAGNVVLNCKHRPWANK